MEPAREPKAIQHGAQLQQRIAVILFFEPGKRQPRVVLLRGQASEGFRIHEDGDPAGSAFGELEKIARVLSPYEHRLAS
jgi:hypothetical protein